MSRTTLSRVSLVLGLAAVLSLAPRPTWAGTPHPSRPHSTPAPAQSSVSLLGQAWHIFWSRVGSAIDPNGVSISVVHNGTSVTPVDRNGN
jgi:hypothetical protein